MKTTRPENITELMFSVPLPAKWATRSMVQTAGSAVVAGMDISTSQSPDELCPNVLLVQWKWLILEPIP